MKKITFDGISEKEMRTLERAAWNGELDFNGFPSAEYKFFDTVQSIGQRYRNGKYPLEFCKEDILSARKEYSTEKAEREGTAYVYGKYQEAIMRSDGLRCRINKSRRADEVLELALECIELLTGEKGFQTSIMKNLSLEIGQEEARMKERRLE